jgi:hypothetical protein
VFCSMLYPLSAGGLASEAVVGFCSALVLWSVFGLVLCFA